MSGTGVTGCSIATEQFSPAECVEIARRAESAGFDGFMVADHFQPWVPAQGESAHVWSLLGRLGAEVRGDLVTGVAAPGWRIHPAVMAQAAATLACLFPGRFSLGLGSGEALNEHVVGQRWPELKERTDRLFEAVDLIDQLFESSLQGRPCRYDGRFHVMERTRLWSVPEERPPLLVAAGGPINARRVGQHADGLITVAAPLEKLERVLSAYRRGVEESGREPGPVLLQVHLSWAPTYEQALAQAMEQWPTGAMPFPKADIRNPEDFAAMAALVTPDGFAGRLTISEDTETHRRQIQRYLDLGVDRVFVHNVGRNQDEFFEEFGRSVLPGLHR